MTRAYCGKCKRKVDLVNVKEIEIRGRKAKRGECPNCKSLIIVKG